MSFKCSRVAPLITTCVYVLNGVSHHMELYNHILHRIQLPTLPYFTSVKSLCDHFSTYFSDKIKTIHSKSVCISSCKITIYLIYYNQLTIGNIILQNQRYWKHIMILLSVLTMTRLQFWYCLTCSCFWHNIIDHTTLGNRLSDWYGISGSICLLNPKNKHQSVRINDTSSYGVYWGPILGPLLFTSILYTTWEKFETGIASSIHIVKSSAIYFSIMAEIYNQTYFVTSWFKLYSIIIKTWLQTGSLRYTHWQKQL